MTTVDDIIDNWLKTQCDRYELGACKKRSCNLRNSGGDSPTCEAHETIKKLSDLENKIEEIEDELEAMK